MEMNLLRLDMNPAIVRSVAALLPAHYARRSAPSILSSSTSAGRRTLVTPDGLALDLGGSALTVPQTQIDLNIADNWDADYQTYAAPENRAGKDINLYVTDHKLILSPNQTVPTGYTADNSRKILGFHGLCLSVGTISGHKLSGFLTGDIIPSTIWDIIHRPTCSPAGMGCNAAGNLWVDLYIQSSTGGATKSVFGGTAITNRNWMDHCDDLASVGKRMLWDQEFQDIAEGSNQRTSISGSSNPITTGGHIDTSGRRMVSNTGHEDCCGVWWQWLLNGGYKISGIPDTGDPSFDWYNLPGNKGSLYRQGSSGDIKLLAGGLLTYGMYCGSRSRYAESERWNAYSIVGSRGCAISIGG